LRSTRSFGSSARNARSSIEPKRADRGIRGRDEAITPQSASRTSTISRVFNPRSEGNAAAGRGGRAERAPRRTGAPQSLRAEMSGRGGGGGPAQSGGRHAVTTPRARKITAVCWHAARAAGEQPVPRRPSTYRPWAELLKRTFDFSRLKPRMGA
jgi:hypothetical protein